MGFGIYRADVARAAGGLDMASLAGNDRVDPFDFLKFCSSAFWCSDNGSNVPLTRPLWNGLLALETGSTSSAVFTCSCAPTFTKPDTTIVALGGGPLTIVVPVLGALTGDFYNITYSGTNSDVITIDYNIAAGTPKLGVYGFYVLAIHSRSALSFLDKSVALEGGTEGTSIVGY